MDILKVLSRGIKQNKKNPLAPGASTGSTQLPSAGARTNPQFFHDDVGGTRGKKRKRRKGAQDEEEDEEENDVSDVDYFAPKPAPGTESQTPSAANLQPEPPKRKQKLLDEDDCRQIFRSHRLKLTILSGREAAEAPPAETKVVKKAKKDKEGKAAAPATTTSTAKADKKQIYPQPLNSFSELRHVYGVAPQLVDNLTRQGFRAPTEVQMGSLPLLLRPETALRKAKDMADVDAERGIDFLGVAPTGSGKTISFLIPAIDSILRRRAQGGNGAEDHVLEAVVVAPTRELASQIVNEGRKLAIGTGVRVVLMKRTLRLVAEDVEQEAQPEDEDEKEDEVSEEDNDNDNEVAASDASGEEISDAEHGGKDSAGAKPPARVDILVTTPKILLNFLGGEKTGVKKTLPSVKSLVLDEADVLLDPVFRKQTLGIWRTCSNPNLRLTCWSATMGSNIEALLSKQLEKRTNYMKTQPKPLVRLVVGLKDTAVPNVTHKLTYTATEAGKLMALRQLLHPVSSADSGPPLRPPFLVFTQTIERAQALHDELKYDIPLEAGGSMRVAVLHSSLPDSVRSKIMARFRSGEVWVLITTDVLARGVDFAGVNGVVNYDVPNSAAAYVHRAGRTGRAGREGGVAVTFYTKDDIPFVKSVANVIAMSERQAGKGALGGGGDDASSVQKWLLDALPKVAKEDKRKLKVRGMESRRSGGKATITTKSSWERRRDNNKQSAIDASKKRKQQESQQQKKRKKAGGEDDDAGDNGEWGGLDD
ncbi:P-loop containing nucleoside triphosphate hydrolase protein [Bombardia bombarda]|uniref:ATP-dependent RNA helicase ROK1 n=1 Tax=Bombardia bombarda TaxID=252184 RepID=A0AA40C9J2_9PEZI|nr:P-loop containing nucleoside triphosphate hydrolase protein [Bombardia bombarda]